MFKIHHCYINLLIIFVTFSVILEKTVHTVFCLFVSKKLSKIIGGFSRNLETMYMKFISPPDW